MPTNFPGKPVEPHVFYYGRWVLIAGYLLAIVAQAVAYLTLPHGYLGNDATTSIVTFSYLFWMGSAVCWFIAVFWVGFRPVRFTMFYWALLPLIIIGFLISMSAAKSFGMAT